MLSVSRSRYHFPFLHLNHEFANTKGRQSPAHNILVESIYCNWSGGSAMGSLGANTDISDIHYRNVYSQNCNQMYMIKSWGGSGSVKNVKLENFLGHSNAYALDLNAYWSSMTQAAGSGVSYQNITFSNWKGTNANGAQRGAVQVLCPSAVPCTGITIQDVNIWTESGSIEKEACQNAYGTGACLRAGSGGTYTTTVTRTAAR